LLDQPLPDNSTTINLTWKPNGTQLATADGQAVYVSDTTTWVRTLLTTLPTEITSLVYSPDGNQLAGIDGQGTIYIFNSTNGQLVSTLPGTSTTEYTRNLVWGENNKIAATNTDQILVWNATAGTLLSAFAAPGVVDVAWLSGNRILYGGSETLTNPLIIQLVAETPTVTQTSTFTPHTNADPNRDADARVWHEPTERCPGEQPQRDPLHDHGGE
jgi:WD40 repeat protein